MGRSRNPLISALIQAGRRMDERRLIAGTEGNLSARDDRGITITASGTFNGLLREDCFLVLGLNGEVREGKRKPSSEAEAHLAVYRAREDVRAVIHAHPPHVIALMLRGDSLEAVPLPEAAYAFGSVPTCPFAVPGTPEGGRAVSEWIRERDALLLDRHGALTVGRSLDEALARMEMLEAVARVVLLAGGSGALKKMTAEQVQRVARAAREAGCREAAISAWEELLLQRRGEDAARQPSQA